MRLRYRDGALEHIVELGPLGGATVSDLAAALPNGGTGDLHIDGQVLAPTLPLVDVTFWEGSLAELCPPHQSHPRSCSRQLVVTGGLQAGDVLDAPADSGYKDSKDEASKDVSWVIGRGRDCDLVLTDPTVSRRHAKITAPVNHAPTVTDLGSHNGTVINGSDLGEECLTAGESLRLGATRVACRSLINDRHAEAEQQAGRISFNRPPRRKSPTPVTTLKVPADPSSVPKGEPLSWVQLCLPVIVGLVLAVLWSPYMAVFSILGPVLSVGTWLERKRRARKRHEKLCLQVDASVERIVRALPGVWAAEKYRRMNVVCDPAEIVRRAETSSVKCWERRRGDSDAMRLGIGTATVPFEPRLEVISESGSSSGAGAKHATGVTAAIASMGPLHDVPIAVALTDGEIIGIVGDRNAARAVARCLVVQAATLHGPADLAVAVFASRGLWAWCKWLPHARSESISLVADIATPEPSQAEPAVNVVEALKVEKSNRSRLLVVDGANALIGRSAPGRVALGLERLSVIVLVDDANDLPADCTTVVEVRHIAGELRLVNPKTSAALESVDGWGMSVATAAKAAAGLARLDDPEHHDATTQIPNRVSLLELVDFGSQLSPEVVKRHWSNSRRSLRTPIGVDGTGPVMLDLVADGPHLLVGGTTGSGKSELLRSLVAGLALNTSPEHLAFVLVDYKGGAAFDCCADLPHVAGLVTDLDNRLAQRALVCLEAELRYREERLRALGVEDLAALDGLNSEDFVADPDRADDLRANPLPRLVVVVDEFATLAAELPDFLSSLVGIAQRGRSLGVHLILATQRPAGVITEDIRANTSTRIALRVTDRNDSVDIIGSPEAANIPRQRPGYAWAKFGPDELKAFQCALVSEPSEVPNNEFRAKVLCSYSLNGSVPIEGSVRNA